MNDSILKEIYFSTLRPDSEFCTPEGEEQKRAYNAVNTLLVNAGINSDSLMKIQDTISEMESIQNEEGFMSGFKYAMQLCAECQPKGVLTK